MFPDGTKVVNYTDGTVRTVYNGGYEEIFFVDGTIQKVDNHGVVTIENTDGTKDIIYPDQKRKRIFADGRIVDVE